MATSALQEEGRNSGLSSPVHSPRTRLFECSFEVCCCGCAMTGNFPKVWSLGWAGPVQPARMAECWSGWIISRSVEKRNYAAGGAPCKGPVITGMGRKSGRPHSAPRQQGNCGIVTVQPRCCPCTRSRRRDDQDLQRQLRRWHHTRPDGHETRFFAGPHGLS